MFGKPREHVGLPPVDATVHPSDGALAVAEERLRRAGRQAAAVVALLAGACAAGLTAGADVRAVAAAGGAVLVVLAIAAALALDDRRAGALALIARGDATPPLPAVRRERARLTRSSHVRALAHSLDAMRAEAQRPYRDRPIGRPLYTPAVIVAVDAELARVSIALRTSRPEPTAIARTELLLGSAFSPLYGTDLRPLRDELGRLLFLLDGSADASVTAGSTAGRTSGARRPSRSSGGRSTRP